ncbi:GGDEF domain-containing protein [Alteromonas gilva]|uniref:diguanylate cyclase n=1 Tax=Alteromonas gilva TaxID=2987522 RepID=A0ABT5KZT0_9ALTE|nr:GGDEF domain-containing protein [Alteromonas gilva]MDC8830279.1 GGDEF domain-containing protein [Alteromonas gilva]
MLDSKKHNHKINLQFIKVCFVVTLLGTLVRPLFIDLPFIFTGIGLLNLLSILVIYVVVKRHWCQRFEALSVFLIGVGTVTPLMVISGGINSQFAPIIPLIPLATALIGGVRMSMVVSVLLIGLITLFVVFHSQVADFTQDSSSQAKVVSRAVWYGLTLCATCYFGIFFYRRNQYLQQQLEKMATMDELTGVFNRRGFMALARQQLTMAYRNQRPFCIILLDIDHFKHINDTHGHDAGDMCLSAVATSIDNELREQDILGRYGGEEFILFLPDTNLQQSKRVAEKIRRAIALMVTGDEGLRLTVTQGIAGYEGGNLDDIEHYISLADEALYQGKESGRNKWVLSA